MGVPIVVCAAGRVGHLEETEDFDRAELGLGALPALP